jgi:hypothetical protein
MDPLNWIVCWVDTQHGSAYSADESYAEAKAFYDALIAKGDVSSITLCAVIESTDYDVHRAFKENPDP